jgi:hypothetical protein
MPGTVHAAKALCCLTRMCCRRFAATWQDACNNFHMTWQAETGKPEYSFLII